jgi:sulfite exporter TauE/SafE
MEHRPGAFILGVVLLVLGVLVCVFRKAILRVVANRQRAMYDKRGDQFATRLRPVGYLLAGRLIGLVGCGFVFLALLG